MSNINFEEVSFKIIAHSGEAKGFAMEAINASKNKDYDKAYELLENAEKSIIEAEKAHMDIVVEEANGIQHPFSVLFIHSEDQLLTTQTVILLAKEFIELYKKVN